MCSSTPSNLERTPSRTRAHTPARALPGCDANAASERLLRLGAAGLVRASIYTFEVPEGVGAGDQCRVSTPGGLAVVTVPDDCGVGSSVAFTLPERGPSGSPRVEADASVEAAACAQASAVPLAQVTWSDREGSAGEPAAQFGPIPLDEAGYAGLSGRPIPGRPPAGRRRWVPARGRYYGYEYDDYDDEVRTYYVYDDEF